ncbi:RNA polymerase sigma factor [Microbacterium sp. NPDC089698]|jgi:RNA polymerase sigma factor (sigma-70 family)|uniref:RNA polymerase sigma factor n=1 Tax=Microbacterium sp. NPDC089698 TaxID=3364200 RepID=UPI0037F8AD91
MAYGRSDAELLRQVRAGDRRAYATLWENHYDAGVRYARKFLPERSEDLASEAFLRVYQQVTTTTTGPEFAFRSYLKAVIRNTAMRWRREAEFLIDAENIDQVDDRDGLAAVGTRSGADTIAQVFGTLPLRWQRVLWLADVEQVSRTAIAEDLGIRPNAVSALHRRARAGFKLRWIELHLPPLLRDRPDHAVRLFPRYLTEPSDAAVAAEVVTHLAICVICAHVLPELVEMSSTFF